MTERRTAQLYKKKRRGGFNNPFFPQRQKKQTRKRGKRTLVGPILLLCGLIGASVALMEYPLIRVKTITITGAQLNAQESVQSAVRGLLEGRRGLIVRNDHILFLPTNEIQNTLKKQFALADVAINRHWPDEIAITIGEREPILRLYYPPDKFSVIDKEGVAVITEIGHKQDIVVEQASSTQDSKTTQEKTDNQDATDSKETPPIEPTIESVVECTFCDTMEHLTLVTASSTPPTLFEPGTSFLPETRVSAILTIIKRFEDLSIPVSTMLLDQNEPNTLEITVLEGFKVYLDLEKDLTAQIANLSVLLEEKYPVPPRSLEYIDVRYGNRLYYQ